MTAQSEIDNFRARCEKALIEQAQVSGWSDDRIAWLRRQVNAHAKACHKLRKHSASGHHCKASKLQARILASFPARLCGKLYETKYGNKASTPLLPADWDEYEKQINRVPLKRALADACHVFVAKKANGAVRWINSPGTLTRQAQRSLANVLNAKLPLNDTEFSQKGKGREAAVEEVIRQITEDKISAFIIFDLADFFSSVRPDHLQWLQLPEHVVNHAVYFNNEAVQIVQKGMSYKTEPARRGLPQGAIVSGQIASALLWRELRFLNGAMGKVTYVDDGVIGASSPVQAAKIAKALKTRFAKLKGGPISFKKIEVRTIDQGFEFLGYWIQQKHFAGCTELAVLPGHKAKKKFQRKLRKKIKSECINVDYDRAVEIFEAYFRRWRRSFAHWSPSDEQLAYTENELRFSAEI